MCLQELKVKQKLQFAIKKNDRIDVRHSVKCVITFEKMNRYILLLLQIIAIEWLTKLNLTNEFKSPSLVELPSICILSLGNKTIYVFKREKFRQISFQQAKRFAW